MRIFSTPCIPLLIAVTSGFFMRVLMLQGIEQIKNSVFIFGYVNQRSKISVKVTRKDAEAFQGKATVFNSRSKRFRTILKLIQFNIAEVEFVFYT